MGAGIKCVWIEAKINLRCYEFLFRHTVADWLRFVL